MLHLWGKTDLNQTGQPVNLDWVNIKDITKRNPEPAPAELDGNKAIISHCLQEGIKCNTHENLQVSTPSEAPLHIHVLWKSHRYDKPDLG